GEGLEFCLKERDADGGSQVEAGAARGGVDEADEVAPLVAVLHRGHGALPIEAPDLVQERLEPDPMLSDRPEFDGGLGEGGRDLAQERPDVFFKASCSAGAACTGRGRGLRRLPPTRGRCTPARRRTFYP